MIIEKIEIESFASHRGVVLELSDGINLIEGTNESGKSSIADFIKFILYGVGAKASDGHLAERKRVMNFNDSHIAGAMRVRVGERTLRISRNTAVSGTVRESVRTSISVIDEATGEDIYDGREPGEMLLGIPEDLFSASVYLSQRSPKISGASVNEAISNILFSGDERMSAERAQERIEQARIPLSHKHGRVGKIYDIREELDSLRALLREQLATNERILALEASINEKKKTNGEHIGNFTELEKQKRAYELTKVIESCEALEGAEREKVDSELRLLGYEGEAHIPTDAEIEELYAYERSLRLLEGREQELVEQREAALTERESLEGAMRLASIVERYPDVCGKVGGLLTCGVRFFVLAVIFATLAAASVGLSFVLGNYTYISAAVSAALGVIFAILSLQKKKEAHSILSMAECASTEQLEVALSRLEYARVRTSELDTILEDNARESSEFAEIARDERARFAEYLAEMDIEGDKAAVEHISAIGETFRARVSHHRELESRAREKRAYYEALLARAEDADADKVRAQLAELGVENADTLDPERITRNIQFYREQYTLLSEKIHSLELELADLRARVSSPAAIQERITYLEGELFLSERKHAVYVLAVEGLKRASEELRRSVAPTLARISGEYMSTLTDGRYTEMSLDSSFALTYKSAGEQRHIDHMSTGTRDMAYLSLRLALSDVISSEGRMPVMLDEATAHMDDTRACSLIRLLTDRAARGHQHILFTCHKREAQLLAGIAADYKHIVL